MSSRRARAGLALVAALAAGLALAEGVARALLPAAGALPPIFVERDGRVALRADTTATLRRADGVEVTAHTDRAGRRAGPEAPRAVVYGGAQVFGLAVADGDTFAAGAGLQNAGVPGAGLAEAIAEARATHPTGLRAVFVFDQLELGAAAGPPWVRGGRRLTDSDRARPGAWLWDTPLSRSALLGAAWPAAAPAGAPAWLTDPASAEPRVRELAAALRALQAELPTTAMTLVWLPADVATSPERAAVSPLAAGVPVEALRPWEDRRLREAARLAWGGRFVDLGPELGDPGDFVAGGTALSAPGHARVAARLAQEP